MNAKIKFTISILFVIYSNVINAQWQPLNGPYGYETSNTLCFDSLCYSSTLKGLVKSINKGANWAINDSTLNGTNSYLVCKEGKLIFDRAFNTTGGLLSLDSGKTWTHMSSIGLYAPIKYEVSQNKIYVWCSYGFLYKSSDNGNTWNVMTGAPSTNNTTDFSVCDGRVYVCKSSFGSSPANIYYSDNDGTNWQTISTVGITGTTFSSYQIIPFENTIYMICNSEIYKSNDKGNTWFLFNNGLPSNYCCNTHFTHLSIAGDKIYATISNVGGFYQSDTTNASFIKIDNGLPLESYVGNVTEIDSILYASTSAGLFTANKNQLNWTLNQTGILSGTINSICSLDSNLFISGYKGFQVSHNYGDTFEEMPLAQSTSNISIEGSSIYASVAQGYKSIDGGHTWSSVNYPYGYFNQNLIDVCSTAGVYMGVNMDYALKTSTNNGVTWNVAGGVPANTSLCTVSSNSRIFVGTSIGIYKSSNLGSSWTTSLTGNVIRKMLVDNGNVYALSDSELYVSNNNGQTWNAMNYPGSFINTFTVKNNFVVVSPGLYYTNNFGSTWSILIAPTQTGYSGPVALHLNDKYLYAGFTDSVFRYPSLMLTGIEKTTFNNNYIEIFPNPTQDNINIKLASNIDKINIFDAFGRLVWQKMNIVKSNQMTTISIENLMAGIYFVEVQSEKKSITKKVIKY